MTNFVIQHIKPSTISKTTQDKISSILLLGAALTLISSKTASTATGSTAAMSEPKRKVSRRPSSSASDSKKTPVLPIPQSAMPGLNMNKWSEDTANGGAGDYGDGNNEESEERGAV